MHLVACIRKASDIGQTMVICYIFMGMMMVGIVLGILVGSHKNVTWGIVANRDLGFMHALT